MLKKPHMAGEAHAEEKKAVAFVDIREMTVNLAPEPSQDHQRFLKFRVALEVKDSKTVDRRSSRCCRASRTASRCSSANCGRAISTGSAGVYRLREELVRRVNIAVYPAKVDAVLFKDIVIQ